MSTTAGAVVDHHRWSSIIVCSVFVMVLCFLLVEQATADSSVVVYGTKGDCDSACTNYCVGFVNNTKFTCVPVGPSEWIFNMLPDTQLKNNWIKVYIKREWAPIASDFTYFYATHSLSELDVETQPYPGRTTLYQGTPFYRVVEGFVAQFGLNLDPGISNAVQSVQLPEETIYPPSLSNVRGTLAYAANACNVTESGDYRACDRNTEMYINYGNNSRLDPHGFAPFGQVLDEGMIVADGLYSYGDVTDLCKAGQPCRGVNVSEALAMGSEYLYTYFPQVNSIKAVTVAVLSN
eukprot:Nk52_evm15s242 gene=Nk52_evmTU15s242